MSNYSLSKPFLKKSQLGTFRKTLCEKAAHSIKKDDCTFAAVVFCYLKTSFVPLWQELPHNPRKHCRSSQDSIFALKELADKFGQFVKQTADKEWQICLTNANGNNVNKPYKP